MMLTVRVIAIEDGSVYVDKRPRVTFRISEADSWQNKFTITVYSADTYKLGEMHDLELRGCYESV